MARRHASKPTRGGARPGAGRKPGATPARETVAVRFAPAEIAAIRAAVAAENAELAIDAPGEPPATVSSWIRDHALDPLGLATCQPRSGDR